ncbi:unnamed protein product [Caenorhabditis brenneri]
MITASQLYRKGKRILKVPLNGQQKYELKNNGSKSRYIEVTFHSSRLSILESRRMSIDDFEFSVYLKPKNSLIFTVADRGRVENTKGWTITYEGLLGITATERECVEGQTPKGPSLQLPYIVITLDPETDSYKTFCEIQDDNAEMVLEHIPLKHPMNKIITIEPLSKGKYEKTTVPENVTILKLSEKDEEDNRRIEKEIAKIVRIAMEERKNRPEKEPPKLDPIKGSNTYVLGQGWRTLRNEESISAKSEKKNESNSTEAQQMYKWMEKNLKSSESECLTQKINDMIDKLNDERDQMYQENKDEKSEGKSMSENPKFTLKSEKTTRSELNQKSEKVDLPQLKNEERKKQKKKKCVIS